MINKLFSKIFGTHNDRELKSLMPIIDIIESLEDEYKAMSDETLKRCLNALIFFLLIPLALIFWVLLGLLVRFL